MIAECIFAWIAIPAFLLGHNKKQQSRREVMGKVRWGDGGEKKKKKDGWAILEMELRDLLQK